MHASSHKKVAAGDGPEIHTNLNQSSARASSRQSHTRTEQKTTEDVRVIRGEEINSRPRTWLDACKREGLSNKNCETLKS